MAAIWRCCRKAIKLVLVLLLVTLYVWFFSALLVHLSSEGLTKHTPNWRTATALSIIRANSIHKFVHYLDMSFLGIFFVGNALALLGLITLKPRISVAYWLLAMCCLLVAIPHFFRVERNPMARSENFGKNAALLEQLKLFKLGEPPQNVTDPKRLEAYATWRMLKDTFKCCSFGDLELYNITTPSPNLCPRSEDCVVKAAEHLRSENDYYIGVVVFQILIALMNVIMSYVVASKKLKPAEFYAWLAEVMCLGSNDDEQECSGQSS